MKTRNKILLSILAMVGIGLMASHAALVLDTNLTVTNDAQDSWHGVVFLGDFGGTSNIPATGAGTRFMWYPKKAALRAGRVTGTQWNDANIGNYSVALGYNVWATGVGSVALGHGAGAFGGTGSVALGYGASANGTGAVALGSLNSASGVRTTAIGYGHDIGGFGAVGIGDSLWTEADHAVVIGRWNYVYGESAVTLGRYLEGNSFAMVAVGQYNEIISGSSTSWVPTDPLFVIGNGTAWNNTSNAMVVLKNGDTTINGKLNVTGQVTIPAQGDIQMGQFGN